MSCNRLAGALAGSLLLVLCCAGIAAAAGPARVTFRVEGDNGTLVPQTTFVTDGTPVVKDGDPQHSCSGYSVAGALEKGTAGDWTAGPWSSSFGYFVQSIKGVSPTGQAFWSLWVNNKDPQVGICDAQLQNGDDVLFTYCHGFDPNTYQCTDTPLGVLAPQTARPGVPFSVTVVKYSATGDSSPVEGATVTGGGAPAVSGPDGTASVTLGLPGTASLFATKTGLPHSGAATVCASNGSDGACGTPDRTAPRIEITKPRAGHVFGGGHGPRLLAGNVAVDFSGLRDVRLRLNRRLGRACFAYDATRERLRRRSCRAPRGRFFSAGDREDWSYLLPDRLPRGRYVLDAIAIDKNGNRSLLEPGVSRIAFQVGGR